jgi:uncharacterized protein YjbI with pentapeptide repeats
MARCKDHEICGLEDAADPEAGLCILHCQPPHKDSAAFTAALTVHRAKRGNNFTRMVFPGVADFAGATFSGTVFFNGATFLGPADFTGATFADAAFFHEAIFAVKGDFTWATFGGPATFSRARFLGPVVWSGATFSAAANFNRVEFGADAAFPDVTFSGSTDFSASQFAGAAAFGGATFLQIAEFADAVFRGRTEFSRSAFREATSFRRATFGDVAFQETAFDGPSVDFGGGRFAGETRFTSRREGERTLLVFAGVQVDFREVAVDPAAAVCFLEADLRLCRFLGTDLERIRLARALWPSVRDHGDVRVGVYDEVAPLPPGEARPWARVARLYRDLKRQYAGQGDYGPAGEFHCGEQEMQRRDPATPAALRALLLLSWALWGHGERFLRPLLWCALLLGLSTLAYLMGGLVPAGGGAPLTPTRPWDWLRSGHYALQVMTLLGPDDLAPVQCAKGVATLQRLAGAPLLALAVVAVYRRLRW